MCVYAHSKYRAKDIVINNSKYNSINIVIEVLPRIANALRYGYWSSPVKEGCTYRVNYSKNINIMSEFVKVTITTDEGEVSKFKITPNGITDEDNKPLDIDSCGRFYNIFKEINKAFIAYGAMILENSVQDMMNIK